MSTLLKYTNVVREYHSKGRNTVKEEKSMSRLEAVEKVLCAFQILRTLSLIMRLIEAFPTNQILGEETPGTANWTSTFSRDFFQRRSGPLRPGNARRGRHQGLHD